MRRDWQIGARLIGFKEVGLIPMKRVSRVRSGLVWVTVHYVKSEGRTDGVAPKHIVAHLHRPWLNGEEVESVRPLFKVDGSWDKALRDKEFDAWMEQ